MSAARVVIVIALTALCVTAGVAAQPARAPLSGAFAERVKAAVTAFDRSEGYKSADSGDLAWGESYVLSAYYWMFEATGDSAWLDRIVRRADVIFANLSPGDDGFPGWRTTRYSVALVDVSRAPGNASPAIVRGDPARIYDIETAHRVTGHAYELRIGDSGTVEITDTTTSQRVASVELAPDGRLTQMSGVSLIIEGKPQPGDRFIIKTQAPKAFEYVVHDGMILTPIAQFCAAVLDGGSLERRYGAAARRYLQVIETQLLPKWEPYWRDLDGGAGVYVAQDDPAHREPGASLPHNQYLALGRTYIALYRLTRKPAYREHIAKMARFFKRSLRLVGGHYEWNYWDYTGPRDDEMRRMAAVEDSSHGTIDIGFAIDAYDAGIVFDRADMQRFARTVTEAMWNSSEEQPRVGARINSPKGEAVQSLDWVRLGRFSPTVRRIMMRMMESSPNLYGPQATAAAQALAMERVGWPRRAGSREQGAERR